MEQKYSKSKYRRVMGRSKEYGTDFEIAMFVKIYETSIGVFRKSKDSSAVLCSNFYFNEDVDNKNSPEHYIMFKGENSRLGHWVVLAKR